MYQINGNGNVGHVTVDAVCVCVIYNLSAGFRGLAGTVSVVANVNVVVVALPHN